MKSWLFLCLATLAQGGCDYQVAPVGSPATQPSAAKPIQPRTDQPASPEPAKASAARLPAAPARTKAGASRSPAILVQLSTGTAAPQTLPEGTMMGFSVDYFVVAGMPNPATKYAWVIERDKGKPVRIPAPLERRGTLQAFVPWSQGDGPFQSHLEDASGAQLSDSIEMRGLPKL